MQPPPGGRELFYSQLPFVSACKHRSRLALLSIIWLLFQANKRAQKAPSFSNDSRTSLLSIALCFMHVLHACTDADTVCFVILIVVRGLFFLKLSLLTFTPCFVHADRDPGIALLSLALSIHRVNGKPR